MNPLAKYSNDEIVEQHCNGGANSHFVSEMLRRLMVDLASQHGATNKLTKRVEKLNSWLLWSTIAIFALTAVLALIGFGILRPIR